MPMLTPSRIAIAVLSLSLFSFFWTLGFPYQLGEPSRPVIDHYEHKNVHSEPIIPAPSIPPTSLHATRPTPTIAIEEQEEEGHHRWDDATRIPGQGVLPGPTQTGIAEFEQDGGRWEDKQKDGTPTAPATPTTLSTLAHALPRPSDSAANAVNANATAPATAPTPSPSKPISKFCKDVRGAPHVMVVLRTSKAEIFDRLPTHIQHLRSCVPNFAIFSDHAGEIDGIPVHNALDNIGSDAKRTHDEFREYQIMHADPAHEPDGAKTKNLDKWKFLPMVYKAYHLKPDAKFFVFIEADTSLSWTNLLQWVSRLDYRIPYYSGAPTFINNVQIAQRGSGILLSQGALRRYAKSYDELYTSKWEAELGKACCGDLALAQALADAHVEFYSSWPLMQGEQPASLDYTDKQWCAPAVTWHHTNSDVLSEIWTAQKNWTAAHGWDTPFLYRDAFHAFVTPYISAKKENWDSISQDTKIVAPQGRQKQLKDEEERSRKHEAEEKKKTQEKEAEIRDEPIIKRFSLTAHEDSKPKDLDWDKLADTFKDAADSPDKCRRACEQIENCLQWRYKGTGDGECHLGKVLRLGKAVKEEEKWSSGWVVQRVDKVTESWKCDDVKWNFYQ